MRKLHLPVIVMAALAFGPAMAKPVAAPADREAVAEIIRLAASFSCTPRKTCKQIDSCEEAVWLLENCSWGGKLDRDSDGIPCESMC